MKISIITICYNNADTIADTISSILAQTFQNFEYIIVDGGSSDDTLKVVHKYKTDQFRIISEKDEGIYDALNKGVKMARGEIIGLLHADDLYAGNDVLEKVMSQFTDNTVEGVYGDLLYVDRINTNKVVRYWRSGSYRKNSFLWGWMPPHPAFFVRSSVYERYGYFDTTLKSAADYELMLRFIHRYKIKLAYLPEVLVRMRVGGKSNVSLSNRLKANSEDQKAWSINNLKPYWFTRFLKPIRKLKQYIFK